MPRERKSRQPGGKRGPRIPYQLTCSNCRIRKVKCDGTQPQCRICQAYGETCRYDKAPPMSQVLAMAQKIADLEKALAESYHSSGSQDGSIAGPDSRQMTPPTAADAGRPDTSWMVGDRSNDAADKAYYTSTSALEGPTRPDEDAAATGAAPTPQLVHSMDSPQLAFWEQAASQLSAVHLQLPLDTVTHLLATNWAWFHPNFMFVSRPLFLRDAAVGGRHFSPLLLAALCLHSTRLTSHALGENLLAQVRLMLAPELHRDGAVTTVQALLLLSARQVGLGAMSQTWLYSGMAFRMALDLGVFSRRRNEPVADPEMTAVRDQLAWTCYLWDKAISLYLGRTPALQETPNFDPPAIDDVLENEIWSPYFGSIADGTAPAEMFSHTSSCFANFCRLAPIITDILMTVYLKKIPTDPLPFVQQTRKRLEQWRSNSPDHLRVEPGSVKSPPAHILSQNLLYYATIILLHRPFRGSFHCRSICRDASHSMAELIVLLENSFGLTHVSYLMAYCVYIAATVAILDLHDGVEGAQQQIETYLRALHSVRVSCPGIQRSIDLIKNGAESKMPPDPSNLRPTAHAAPPLDLGPLPAFPLDQCSDYTQVSMLPMDILPFGGLDPYALDWSNLSNDSFGDWLQTT